MDNDLALERLKKNDKFLSSNPSNIDELPGLLSSEINLELFEEAGGRYNLAVGVGQGHIPYHRSSDPFGELKESYYESEKKEIAVVMGTGFGYHLLGIIDRLKECKKVYFVEPYFPALFIFLTQLDLDVFLDDRFEVLFCKDPSELVDFLSPRINHYHNTDISFVALECMQTLYPDFINKTADLLQKAWEKHLIYLVSQQQQIDEIINNTVVNMSNLPAYSRIIAGSGRGKTALITGSGPSLSAHIDLLPRFIQDHYLISLGSSHAILNKYGIQPDITVVSDPQDLNKMHFPEAEYPSSLIADVSVVPEIIEKFSGCKTLINIGHNLASLFQEECQLEETNNWGTVSSTGLDICRKMGFSRILLLGVEFSYLTSSHAENYAIKSVAKSGFSERSLDSVGKMVNSTAILKSYAEYVDLQIKEILEEGIEIINCSDGGLLFNAPILSLPHAVNKFRSITPKTSVAEFFAPVALPSTYKEDIFRRLDALAQEIEMIISSMISGDLLIRDALSRGFFTVLESKFWKLFQEIEAAEIVDDQELRKQLLKAVHKDISQELNSLRQRFINALN